MGPMEREPRAALILNRFTRSLTVMFATNAVSSILGVPAEQIKDKSFYECIQENCLQDAIKCLESAKANDSIAYLRFWYRDPRREEDFEDGDLDDDDDGVLMDSDSDGVEPGLDANMDVDAEQRSALESMKREFCSSSSSLGSFKEPITPVMGEVPQPAMPGAPGQRRRRRRRRQQRQRHEPIPSFELEAVVSCTSDGLVVVLRKARPPIPAPHPPLLPFDFENGLFAAPWGQKSITPYYPPELLYTFRPPLLPQFMPLRENVKAAGGPPLDQLMKSIRDVAVFAWALVGINGNLAAYGRGLPSGEAQPPEGLPIWDPAAVHAAYGAPENQAAQRWAVGEDGRGREEDGALHYGLGHGVGNGHGQAQAQAQYPPFHPPIWPRHQQQQQPLPYFLGSFRPDQAGLQLSQVPRTHAQVSPSAQAGFPVPPPVKWADPPINFKQATYGAPRSQPGTEDCSKGFGFDWP